MSHFDSAPTTSPSAWRKQGGVGQRALADPQGHDSDRDQRRGAQSLDARAMGRGEGIAAAIAGRCLEDCRSWCRQGRSGGGVKVDRGWNRHFDDPIPLPDGRMLRTLGDAGHYIAGLPQAMPGTAGMADRRPSAVAGCGTRRAGDVRADRRYAGAEPREAKTGDRATAEARQGLPSDPMNRIGRRITMCMLLIAAFAQKGR